MSCSISNPSNGIYMTGEDFQQFQDYIGNLLEGKYKKGTVLARVITFVVTERCDLRCTYCYEDHEVHACGKIMTIEIARQVIDMLFEKEKMENYYDIEDYPAVILDMIGGEPFLNIEVVDFIVDYFKLKAFEMNHPWAYYHKISISTNGMHHFEPKVQAFLKKNAGNVSCSVSLDGYKELHDTCRLTPNGKGSYDIAEKALKDTLITGSANHTKFTLAPENVQYAHKGVMNLISLGVQAIHVNTIYEEGWTTNDAKTIYEQFKLIADEMVEKGLYKNYFVSFLGNELGGEADNTVNYCGGNGAMLAFGPDGDAYPCLRYMKHSMTNNREPLKIGCAVEGLGNNPIYKGIIDHLQGITLETQSENKCLTCPISQGCGLCSAHQYDKFGDANIRATYICEMHQARVMVAHYYIKKIYEKEGLEFNETLNIPKEWALNIISEKEYEILTQGGS
jgi:uncharacterized protein